MILYYLRTTYYIFLSTLNLLLTTAQRNHTHPSSNGALTRLGGAESKDTSQKQEQDPKDTSPSWEDNCAHFASTRTALLDPI